MLVSYTLSWLYKISQEMFEKFVYIEDKGEKCLWHRSLIKLFLSFIGIIIGCVVRGCECTKDTDAELFTPFDIWHQNTRSEYFFTRTQCDACTIACVPCCELGCCVSKLSQVAQRIIWNIWGLYSENESLNDGLIETVCIFIVLKQMVF